MAGPSGSLRSVATVIAAVLCAAVFAFSAPVAFALPAEPELDSLSASAGSPGTPVTFRGSGFGDSSPTSFVTFSGVRATVTGWSDTQVVALVPAKAVAGYAGITVDNVTSNGLWFAPAGRPTVTSVSPQLAPPGSTVTLLGRGFGTTQRNGRVAFSGTPATVLFWSDVRITAVVPQIDKASYVGVWQNGAPSNGVLFTPIPPPDIDSISRSKVLVGDSVTVQGVNFGVTQGPGRITIGGAEAEPLSWSSTSLTFVVPPDANSGYVGVWRGNVCSNGAWLAIGGRIQGLACDDSGSSWWGPPGSELTINGTGFGATPSKVTLGGKQCQIVSWANERVVVTVPVEGTEGYLGVWRGSTASNGVWFWSQRRPHIDSISPYPVHPGDEVTIRGTGFGAKTPSSKIKIANAEVDDVSWSDTEIKVLIGGEMTPGYAGVWKRGVASNGKWVTFETP